MFSKKYTSQKEPQQKKQGKAKIKFISSALISAALFAFMSCATSANAARADGAGNGGESQNPAQTEKSGDKEAEKAKKAEEAKRKEIERKLQNASSTIDMLFAGDVMAHEENFKPGKFDRIWKYVSQKIQEADLAFCNLESPVMDSKRWMSYPTFNMHTDYVEEAIKAGFDVFSLANNHTNDQYLKGINSTREYFKGRNDVWAAGVREKQDGPLTYQIVEKEVELKDENGNAILAKDESGNEKPMTDKWRILFVAMTELLNRNDYESYIDHYPRNRRTQFKEALKKLRSENEHDLFIVSVHTDEPEYVLKVSADHRSFCHQLIDECGVDIVWGNHPHVVQEWEKVETKDNRDAFIMYANGNTISGQRRTQHFDNPGDSFDYRGEGIFMELSFEKRRVKKDGEKKSTIKKTKASLITVMVAADDRYVIRFLDDRLLEVLDEAEYLQWKDYLSKRKKLMESYLPKGDW